MSAAFASRPTGRWSSPASSEAAAPDERRWPAEGRPAIILPEPPPAWRDFEELRNQAQAMLDSRRQSFPQRIAAGKLCPDEAARELRAFSDLVRDWEFICDGDGQPADTGSEQARRDALDQAIIRIAAYAAQHGGFSDQLEDQAHRVIALRWHLEPGRRTIAMARLTHELRAEARVMKGDPQHA